MVVKEVAIEPGSVLIPPAWFQQRRDHNTRHQLLLSALYTYYHAQLLNQGKADEVEQAIRKSIKKWLQSQSAHLYRDSLVAVHQNGALRYSI